MIKHFKTSWDVAVFKLSEGEEGGRGASCRSKEEEKDEGGDRGSQGSQDQEEGGRRAAAMALVMFCVTCVCKSVLVSATETLCYSRWEEEKYEDGVKWKFLEHNGPYFPPEYQPLPDNVKFYYDGTLYFPTFFILSH